MPHLFALVCMDWKNVEIIIQVLFLLSHSFAIICDEFDCSLYADLLFALWRPPPPLPPPSHSFMAVNRQTVDTAECNAAHM